MKYFNFKNINIQLLLIISCAFLVHANTLFNGFVFDDHSQIVNNTWITNIKYIPDIFAHDATRAEISGISNYYRPVMNLTYMITYYVFSGLKPWGFHLVNILLHVGVTILVFLTVTELLRDVDPTYSRSFISVPLVTALIFAVHPINSEVIAWVACVPELSFTFFCLLSLYFHMKSLKNFDRNHLLSLSSFGIAILCKETTVTLLPLLVLYDYLFQPVRISVRRNVVRYLPFALIVGLYLTIRFLALGGIAPSSAHPELSTFEEIINTIPHFSLYIEKLVLPINLSAIYVLHPVHLITEPRFLISVLILMAFIALGYVLFQKNKYAFLGLMIISIPLLPVLYIRGLGETTFAERYLYFPSIGFALTAGTSFSALIMRNVSWRKPLSLLLGSVLVAYSIGTVLRNNVWHDDLSLWTDTVRKSPDSQIGHANLGLALAEKGDLDAAIQEYRMAIRIKPNYTTAHYNLGVALAAKGDLDAAIQEYRMAIWERPYYSKAHCNLGVALAKKGDLDAAIQEFQEALRTNPTDTIAYNCLELLLLQRR